MDIDAAVRRERRRKSNRRADAVLAQYLPDTVVAIREGNGDTTDFGRIGAQRVRLGPTGELELTVSIYAIVRAEGVWSQAGWRR